MKSPLVEILLPRGGGGVERFGMGTEVISGEGSLSVLSRWEGEGLLLVSAQGDGKVQKAAQAARWGKICRLEVFGEPTLSRVMEGVQLLKQEDCAVVVGLGDGRILDCAKAIRGFSQKAAALITIPTAPGCGREVTAEARLLHRGQYHRFAHESLQPTATVLDSTLLGDLPRGSRGEGGFCLLAQALESFSHREAGELCRLFAREGFSACWGALPGFWGGRAGMAGRVQMASVLAGFARSCTGGGLCQALAEAVGAAVHRDPEPLVGIFLPGVIRCNLHAAQRQYAQLARAAGMGGSSDSISGENLLKGVIRLRRELGLPQSLAQAGISPGTVWSSSREILGQVLSAPGCRTNPVAVDDYLLRRLLEEVTGRK